VVSNTLTTGFGGFGFVIESLTVRDSRTHDYIPIPTIIYVSVETHNS